MLSRTVGAVLLFTTAASTGVLAAEGGAIREIRLSSGGLAEISRKAEISADHSITLNVPLDQIDDVLKSLVVNGESLSVGAMSLAGPQPLSESLKALPFNPENLSTVPSLLAAVQGTHAIVVSNGRKVEGKVLGVEPRKGTDGTERFFLTVLDDQLRVDTLELAADATVSLKDAETQAMLTDAVEAIGRARNDRSRNIQIKVAGTEGAQAMLSYVIAAPIWKTAYKVVTGDNGKAHLQAWAVLENASGEDWKGVKLTLSSAAPVTLTQRLHQIYWKDRYEVPVDVAMGLVPDVDSGNLGNRAELQSAVPHMKMSQQARMAAAPAPESMYAADMVSTAGGMGFANVESAAEARESDISAQFVLPDSYDLRNGDTLSVPILDHEIDADMVSLFRAGSSSAHPVAALMLKNDTGSSLPAGILTVYDAQAGYVGDSQLSGLPNGDTRLASFATDRKVSVTTDDSSTRQISQIKVTDGILHSTGKIRIETQYKISGALDGARNVVIEHPVRSGWDFSSDNSDGRTATHHRLKVAVPAGQAVTVTAVDEQMQTDQFMLSDTMPETLLALSDTTTDEALVTRLKELAEARQQQVTALRDLQEINADLERIGEEQGRIRENIRAVPENSDLKGRYLRQLEQSEDQLANLADKRSEAMKNVQGLDGRVRSILRTF